MTILTYFTCMVKIVALKFNNQQKLRYMLSQTYICNLSAHSDHGHLFWASHKTSFQCLHLHRAAINTRYAKTCPGLLPKLKFRSTALICRKSLDNLVLFLNICLSHMHFWQENALQCNMEIVRFSPKTFSRHAVKWRYPYEHELSSCGSNGKCNLY